MRREYTVTINMVFDDYDQQLIYDIVGKKVKNVDFVEPPIEPFSQDSDVAFARSLKSMLKQLTVHIWQWLRIDDVLVLGDTGTNKERQS